MGGPGGGGFNQYFFFIIDAQPFDPFTSTHDPFCCPLIPKSGIGEREKQSDPISFPLRCSSSEASFVCRLPNEPT